MKYWILIRASGDSEKAYKMSGRSLEGWITAGVVTFSACVVTFSVCWSAGNVFCLSLLQISGRTMYS